MATIVSDLMKFTTSRDLQSAQSGDYSYIPNFLFEGAPAQKLYYSNSYYEMKLYCIQVWNVIVYTRLFVWMR